MPRNGSGVYSEPPGTTAASNTTIASSPYNALVADLVADANAARPVTAGGTGATDAATARTNLGAAAIATPEFTGATATVTYTNAGAAVGPTLDLYRDSTSPAASDLLGSVDFNGEDSAGNKQLYARVIANISDATSASEDASLFLQTVAAGTLTTGLTVTGANVAIAGALSLGTDLAVAEGGTGASSASGARDNLGLGTAASPQFATIELGAASDTTLARIAAGRVSIEGAEIATLTGTQTFTNKTLTSPTMTSPYVSSGSMGIGQASPQAPLHITTTSTTAASARLESASGHYAMYVPGATNALRWWDYTAGAQRMELDSSGNLKLSSGAFQAVAGTAAAPSLSFTGDADTGLYSNSPDVIGFATNGAQAAYLTTTTFIVGSATASWGLGSGTTDGVYAQTTGNLTASRDAAVPLNLRRRSSDGVIANFNRDTSTVGSIAVTTTATSFNTSSDERLKDFIGTYDPKEAARIILADPVREFTWKATGDHAVGWGAQTSYAVSPDLATPGHGEPDDEDFQAWGIDQAKRTPYLWAAVADLIGQVEALQAKVAAMEAQSGISPENSGD